MTGSWLSKGLLFFQKRDNLKAPFDNDIPKGAKYYITNKMELIGANGVLIHNDFPFWPVKKCCHGVFNIRHTSPDFFFHTLVGTDLVRASRA